MSDSAAREIFHYLTTQTLPVTSLYKVCIIRKFKGNFEDISQHYHTLLCLWCHDIRCWVRCISVSARVPLPFRYSQLSSLHYSALPSLFKHTHSHCTDGTLPGSQWGPAADQGKGVSLGGGLGVVLKQGIWDPCGFSAEVVEKRRPIQELLNKSFSFK